CLSELASRGFLPVPRQWFVQVLRRWSVQDLAEVADHDHATEPDHQASLEYVEGGLLLHIVDQFWAFGHRLATDRVFRHHFAVARHDSVGQQADAVTDETGRHDGHGAAHDHEPHEASPARRE